LYDVLAITLCRQGLQGADAIDLASVACLQACHSCRLLLPAGLIWFFHRFKEIAYAAKSCRRSIV
jgi:hypothetical protein